MSTADHGDSIFRVGDGDTFGVFLSYRRDEASGHAGRLYDALAATLGPDRVFLDVHGIAPGRAFAAS